MKKAQIEIVGLLVIVIIVSIVLFFGLLFSSTDSEDPAQTEFFDLQVASSTMPAIMESSSGCKDASDNHLSIKDLIDICLANPSFICEGDDVCEYVNNTIDKNLNDSLTNWGLSYTVNISMQDISDSLFLKDVDSCSSRRSNFISELLVVPTSRGTVIANLKLCS
jgi:hypothetical protein